MLEQPAPTERKSSTTNRCKTTSITVGSPASKLWNVARYYTQGRWDDDGEIPDDGELKSELKGTRTI